MVLQRSPKQLAKLIDYILSRRPDEFGLVTNSEGFVKIKELLKALNEEDGLKYVRHSHINEIMVTLPTHGFEVVDKLIRAQNRKHLPKQSVAINPPKLLFTCVRRKAYPYVSNKGIKPTGFNKIILSSDRDLAQRIGRRSDHAAVMLTVQVSNSEDKGVIFVQAGESLFLTDYIPPDCFSGPPLPKESPESRKLDKPQKEPAEISAGSFLIDFNNKEHPAKPGTTSKKRSKKHKRRRERPPWRR